jgi:hypothetical protein
LNDVRNVAPAGGEFRFDSRLCLVNRENSQDALPRARELGMPARAVL